MVQQMDGVGQVDDLRWKGAARAALEEIAVYIGDQNMLDRVTQWQ